MALNATRVMASFGTGMNLPCRKCKICPTMALPLTYQTEPSSVLTAVQAVLWYRMQLLYQILLNQTEQWAHAYKRKLKKHESFYLKTFPKRRDDLQRRQRTSFVDCAVTRVINFNGCWMVLLCSFFTLEHAEESIIGEKRMKLQIRKTRKEQLDKQHFWQKNMDGFTFVNPIFMQ